MATTVTRTMSDRPSQTRSGSSSSKRSISVRPTPPPSTLTPDNPEQSFEPCAATGSFLLYAQRNVILVLHHDTLAIERRFERHREDIKWIAVDNVSEQGAGRTAVSYDAGHSTVIWDILTGHEIARFVAYDTINVAHFMRNGNIAFGNAQGTIILFEPSTDENVCARTIFDPITALAPASDNRTFAIGYLNGSILIATLQPAFTILHTLTTSRAPSKITGLAWHGSSSKQKTDMLATQTADGDLRVWSVPKPPHHESPTIIRALSRSDIRQPGPSWFAWSKNGRLVQYYDGETRSWDVRTKRVTYDIVPTIDGVIGLANYGPTATLFTLGRNHTVQQYDVSPMSVPLQVQSVQHAPANTPPTPPTTLEEQNSPYSGPSLPTAGKPDLLSGRQSDTASSTDESTATSPLDKIAREMDSLDQLQSEIRDKITPLSPTSSRASSTSSKSSGGATHQRKYLYDRPSSSRSSNVTGYEGTEFSLSAASPNHLRDSMSIRSGSTKASQARYRSSSLRREILRSPEESNAQNAMMDLFPFLKAHILDVPLQTPHYGETARTSDMLQREMLSVVFGWNDTAANLVRDEMSKHRVGSASAVLLAKWLGDMGAENMPSLIGSQSMTSSDWMLLALSSIGQDSQKRVGEAFVQRLLEKGDIHPAVAILLGLGELNDAIEVYVSQSYFMEAVLLSCLCLPTDWGRQIYLLRKWGEVAVKSGEPELAVRIFSCASAETTVPWTSPKTQDAVFAARQQHEESMGSASAGALNSPPLSPPSRTASGRLKAKNAPLKLITTFGDKGNPMKPTTDDPTPLAVGVTPIITSAMSPGSWREGPGSRAVSSARTATPGGFGGRRRLPSRTDIARVKQEAADLASPVAGPKGFATLNQAAAGSQGRRTPSVSDAEEPTTALRASRRDMADLASTSGASDRLPSPSLGSLARISAASRSGHHAREKSKDGMRIQVVEAREIDVHPSRATADSQTSGASHQASAERRGDIATPPLTSISLQSSKAKAIDDYINSVEEARLTKRHIRTASRARADHRSRSRADHQTEKAVGKGRETPESRGRAEVRYVAPAKKSPSSPIPMSPEEIAEANAREAEAASHEAENFYKLASPIENKDSHHSHPVSGRHGSHDDNAKAMPPHVGADHQLQSPAPQSMHRNDSRGRHKARGPGSSTRSPSSPLPMLVEARHDKDNDETRSDGNRMRTRAYSSAGRDTTPKRAASSNRVHERSRSQKPPQRSQTTQGLGFDAPNQAEATENFHARMAHLRRPLTRKEIAARELEERRLSLARRPSAPAIPLPSDLLPIRPAIGVRSHTDLDNSPRSTTPPYPRSATADSDIQARYGKATITPTTPAQIGLPATPRAMKHPHFLKPDSLDPDAPPVPAISGSVSSHTGSLLSQVTGSNLSQFAPSSLSQAGPSSSSQVSSSLMSDPPRDAEEDTVGQLLPATVFGKPNNQGIPRAASAPLENSTGPKTHAATKTGQAAHSRRLSTGRGQVRMISPPESPVYETDNKSQIASIDHAIHSNSDQHVIVLDQGSEEDPVLLPELQHLATPPPPPPPPSFYQYIQSTRSEVGVPAIEGNTSITATATSGTASDLSSGPSTLPQYPYSMERASTASPTSHRRGHGSISESFGSRMRGVADRMRGHSRSRAKSPPMLEAIAYVPPYETVLPTDTMSHSRKKSVGRAKSPYEQAMADQQNSMPPPPPPPAPGPPAPAEEMKANELAVPPRSKSAKDVGYRHPKEVRANMPPEHLQSGAQGAGSAGFL